MFIILGLVIYITCVVFLREKKGCWWKDGADSAEGWVQTLSQHQQKYRIFYNLDVILSVL